MAQRRRYRCSHVERREDTVSDDTETNRDQFAGRPTGRAADPANGKKANFKGYTESGLPIYRVPGTSRDQTWVQFPPATVAPLTDQ
jgi:hypothetical protein